MVECGEYQEEEYQYSSAQPSPASIRALQYPMTPLLCTRSVTTQPGAAAAHEFKHFSAFYILSVLLLTLPSSPRAMVTYGYVTHQMEIRSGSFRFALPPLPSLSADIGSAKQNVCASMTPFALAWNVPTFFPRIPGS